MIALIPITNNTKWARVWDFGAHHNLYWIMVLHIFWKPQLYWIWKHK